MSTKATKINPKRAIRNPESGNKLATDLTVTQRAVLAELLSGATVTDAAKSARINRTTVYKWLKKPAFKSALNDSRNVIRQSLHARLMQTAAQAVETVEKAIEDGDAKSALAVLKGLGLLSEESKPANSKEPPGWNGHSERTPAEYEPIADQEVNDEIGELLSDPEIRKQILSHPSFTKSA